VAISLFTCTRRGQQKQGLFYHISPSGLTCSNVFWKGSSDCFLPLLDDAATEIKTVFLRSLWDCLRILSVGGLACTVKLTIDKWLTNGNVCTGRQTRRVK
jgi:hypothetical protein